MLRITARIIPFMMSRVLHVAVLSAVAVLAGCSTLGGYPNDWHGASDVIHVYVSDSAKAIEIPTAGQVITLIDAVLKAGESAGDLSHVVVCRRIGSEMTRLVVDVRDMLRTGNTANNIQLQPGDVIGIAG